MIGLWPHRTAIPSSGGESPTMGGLLQAKVRLAHDLSEADELGAKLELPGWSEGSNGPAWQIAACMPLQRDRYSSRLPDVGRADERVADGRETNTRRRKCAVEGAR
jgi:hypothetical protein